MLSTVSSNRPAAAGAGAGLLGRRAWRGPDAASRWTVRAGEPSRARGRIVAWRVVLEVKRVEADGRYYTFRGNRSVRSSNPSTLARLRASGLTRWTASWRPASAGPGPGASDRARFLLSLIRQHFSFPESGETAMRFEQQISAYSRPAAIAALALCLFASGRPVSASGQSRRRAPDPDASPGGGHRRSGTAAPGHRRRGGEDGAREQPRHPGAAPQPADPGAPR